MAAPAQHVEDIMLRAILHYWGNVPITATLADAETNFQFNPIIASLRNHGISTASTFLSLSDHQIASLSGPTTVGGQSQPLMLAHQVKIRQCIAFFHHQSRELGTQCNPANHRDDFNQYIMNMYSGNSQIIPWTLAKPTSAMSADDIERERFMKQIRLNKNDYVEFKHEASWQAIKESWETNAAAQGLSHILDKNYVPSNPELDKIQQRWLFSVLKDKMKESTARTIVTGFIGSGNARECWAALKEHFDKDITAELKLQELSTFLTSNRSLANGEWKGTSKDYILKWKECGRQYNEISDEEYTDKQLIQFLSAAVSGVSYLQTVTTTIQTTRKVSGINTPLHFSEYIQALINAANLHDSTIKASRGAKPELQSNVHDMGFEDELQEDDGGYQTYIHRFGYSHRIIDGEPTRATPFTL